MKVPTIKKYYTYVAMFIVLNILSTYVVTTESLNHYIVTFDYTFKGIFNSLIGNLSFLLLLLLIINTSTKNLRTRIILMIILSFLLNGFLFWINIYNRFYGTSFTFKAFQIFKNPAGNFGLTIFFEAMREIVTYFRFLIFVPFLILLFVFIFGTTRNEVKNTETKFNIKRFSINLLSVIFLLFINISVFTKMSANEVIVDSAKANYATQNLGIYNYLMLDVVGFDYNNEKHEDKDINENLDIYNKNKDEYINILDNKKYTKNVKLEDIKNISGALVDNHYSKNINGILKDYNIVLVHLETFNYFLLEFEETSKHLYNLKAILEESYTFNNFYNNVGLGNSFDAELSVLTGLYANGTSTIAWEFDSEIEEKNFDLQTLPKLFNQANYNTKSFHGNSGEFYNRENVHPKMFGFEEFFSKEVILEDTGLTTEKVAEITDHEVGVWLSDRFTIDYLNQANEKAEDKFMHYLITMLPHTPFYYDPYYPIPKETDMYSEELINTVDILTLKYFNYLKYYNEIMKLFIADKEGNLIENNNTAYVFYGDHGSQIKFKDVNYLFDNKLSNLEIRQKLSQTISFIYVPGTNKVTKEIDGNEVTLYEGLLKGEQNLVRDQMDLYRTIIDLFDLPLAKDDYLYGVHGMSEEPSFALDNKSLNIITDDFIGNIRNNKNEIYNNQIELEYISGIKAEILNFKKYSDLALNNNMYKEFKKKNKRSNN